MSECRIRRQVWIGITLTAWLSVGCASKGASSENPGPGNADGTAAAAAGTSGATQLGGTGGKPATSSMLPTGASGSSAAVAGMSGSAGAGTGGSSGMSGSAGSGTGGSPGMSGSAGAGTGGSSATTGGADSGTGGSSDVTDDAGVAAGIGAPGDPNGPCKDLGLLCFDAIDMFVLNPECFTCNGGDGCQDCVLFQAE